MLARNELGALIDRVENRADQNGHRQRPENNRAREGPLQGGPVEPASSSGRQLGLHDNVLRTRSWLITVAATNGGGLGKVSEAVKLFISSAFFALCVFGAVYAGEWDIARTRAISREGNPRLFWCGVCVLAALSIYCLFRALIEAFPHFVL